MSALAAPQCPVLSVLNYQPDFMGSDHCPAWVDINVTDSMKQLMDSGPWPVPPLCSSNFPEFMGKQQSLKSFLSIKASTTTASANATTQVQTHRVDVQHVAVASSTISTVKTPAANDWDEDSHQDQKSRKQVKLWSFFTGQSGTPVQVREQQFQSARELVVRSNSKL